MKKPKHKIFYSGEFTNPWRCTCGFLYPTPPVGVGGTPKIFKWLDKHIAEHERDYVKIKPGSMAAIVFPGATHFRVVFDKPKGKK